MVLQYYKSQETLAEIREDLDVGRDGLKLSQLYTYAKNRKMFSKVFSCGINGLKELPLPAIIFWNNQHFVILEKITDHKITVVDPATGRVSMTYDDFAEGYSNVVMVVVPTEEFVAKKEKKHVWNSILRDAKTGHDQGVGTSGVPGHNNRSRSRVFAYYIYPKAEPDKIANGNRQASYGKHLR